MNSVSNRWKVFSSATLTSPSQKPELPSPRVFPVFHRKTVHLTSSAVVTYKLFDCLTVIDHEKKESKPCNFYFGGARSKGFATLRNVSKLPFFDKIGHAKSVGFRFYSAIWRSESRISSRYLEITSISLIYSLPFSRKKKLLFWLSRGFNRLTCVTRQVRGDSKLRD